MRRTAVASLLSIAMGLSLGTCGQAEPLKVVSTGLAVKMATEQLVVHSAKLDRDFLIEVTRPFAPLATGNKAPAVYALDGGYEFTGLEGWLLGGSGGMAGAYIVTVGYKATDYGKRDADLTTLPVNHAGQVEAGRGLAFRAFLMDELRPFIDARYPVDPSQAVLVGHSSGGSFAAALFADRPGAFSAYVIGSPAVWNEPDLAKRIAAAKPGGERIFIAVGGNEKAEMMKGVSEIATAFAAHAGLPVQTKTFPGATHLSYYPEFIAEGLSYVLPPKAP